MNRRIKTIDYLIISSVDIYESKHFVLQFRTRFIKKNFFIISSQQKNISYISTQTVNNYSELLQSFGSIPKFLNYDVLF